MYIKKCYTRFINDYILWGSCIISALLLCGHIYQFVDSGYRIEPLIRIIYCASYIPFVFLCGRAVIPYLFSAFALVLVLFCKFDNYTYIFLLCLASMLTPRIKIPLLCLYAIDALIVCLIHDKSVMHYAIHLVNCGAVVFITEFYNRMKFTHKKLDLTKEEYDLIYELAVNGKHQKELGNQNTIAKKVRQIRDRNSCNSNEELYMKFRQELSTKNQ